MKSKPADDLAVDFLKTSTEKGAYSAATLRSFETDVRTFIRSLPEDAQLIYPTPENTQKLGGLAQTFIRSSNAKSTAGRRLYSLRVFFRYLVEQGLLLNSDLDDFPNPYKFQKEGELDTPLKVLPGDVADQLVRYSEDLLRQGEPFELLFVGSLLSGLKISEVMNLTWDEISVTEDGQRTYFQLAASDGENQGRRVNLTWRAHEAAFQFAVFVGRPQSAERLFTLSLTGIRARLRKLADVPVQMGSTVSDLTGDAFSPNAFRWRAMVDLLLAGASAAEIAEEMGVVETYVRRVLPDLVKIAKSERPGWEPRRD